jgi:hypothetical protein
MFQYGAEVRPLKETGARVIDLDAGKVRTGYFRQAKSATETGEFIAHRGMGLPARDAGIGILYQAVLGDRVRLPPLKHRAERLERHLQTVE